MSTEPQEPQDELVVPDEAADEAVEAEEQVVAAEADEASEDAAADESEPRGARCRRA